MAESLRVALGVEYAGDAFEGWQSQRHGRTVQDHLEPALSAIADHPVRLFCAGRTDTGVHATAQVAHFDTHAVRPREAWVRGVNGRLPDSVAVRWAEPVKKDFHARFSACGRHYRYVLYNHPVRPALLARRVGWYHRPLDERDMARAAESLVGEHNFSAFRAAACQADSPVKRMYRAGVRREGDYIVFDFHANAFLHHMVRNLVGTLVYVGKGQYAPEYVSTLLKNGDRTAAAPTFSPHGLYLCGVDYPGDCSLPGRGRIIAMPRLPVI